MEKYYILQVVGRHEEISFFLEQILILIFMPFLSAVVVVPIRVHPISALDQVLKLPSLMQILNFIFQLSAIVGVMADIAVKPALQIFFNLQEPVLGGFGNHKSLSYSMSIKI